MTDGLICRDVTCDGVGDAVWQVVTREQQIESMGAVARRLEEKERLLQATLSAVEKELLLRQQAMEMHKRKAIESAQSAADLKLHLGNTHACKIHIHATKQRTPMYTHPRAHRRLLVVCYTNI